MDSSLWENSAKTAADGPTNRSSQSTCSSETANFDGSWRKDGTESSEATGTSVAGSVACRLGWKCTFLQISSAGKHRSDLVHEGKDIRVDVRRSFRGRCWRSEGDCREDENEVRCDLHFVWNSSITYWPSCLLNNIPRVRRVFCRICLTCLVLMFCIYVSPLISRDRRGMLTRWLNR